MFRVTLEEKRLFDIQHVFDVANYFSAYGRNTTVMKLHLQGGSLSEIIVGVLVCALLALGIAAHIAPPISRPTMVRGGGSFFHFF